MDTGTTAVYREVIKRYEKYLNGEDVNVIDPDGRTPGKKELRMRLAMMQLYVQDMS